MHGTLQVSKHFDNFISWDYSDNLIARPGINYYLRLREENTKRRNNVPVGQITSWFKFLKKEKAIVAYKPVLAL